MSVARGYSPGKVILAGEHAVVHGHPALALALGRGTTVHLTSTEGPTRLGHSEVQDPRVLRGLRTVLPAHGIKVDISSELPIGRGLGSSAALSVATVRALAAFNGESLDFDTTHARAFLPERVFHGNPSGIDHAVCALGGGVRYTKSPTGPQVTAIELPPLNLVVIDSGSAGDTAELVARVQAGRPQFDPILDEIGSLVLQLEDELATTRSLRAIGALMNHNHTLLQHLGVSTPVLDQIVSTCRTAGALGAKLAGAGGGGVVLALVEDAVPVIAASADRGWSAFSVGVAPRER